MLSFPKDDKLRKTILETGDKEIAEANPSDLYLGRGIALWAQNVAEKSKWKGKNVTGKILQEVRSMLK